MCNLMFITEIIQTHKTESVSDIIINYKTLLTSYDKNCISKWVLPDKFEGLAHFERHSDDIRAGRDDFHGLGAIRRD